MSKNKILVLGAGYGGVHAAKKLAKKYKKNNDVEITLIDKNPYHTLMTELHEVAGGRVHPESVQVELCKIFGKSKVNVVIDLIEKYGKPLPGERTYNAEWYNIFRELEIFFYFVCNIFPWIKPEPAGAYIE